MVSFLAFGLGMGTPLIVFSLASAQWSKQVISFTTTHKTTINRTAGAIMLIISLYYLTCIFSILPFADHPVCTTLSNLFTALA
jgi:cytochrome c-type biogenesis protein